MSHLFRNVPASLIRDFSERFYEAVIATENLDVKSLGELRESRTNPLALPEALAMGALEGTYLPPTRDGDWSPLTTTVANFGSLCAYTIAQAGNASSLDMLDIIAGLPTLTMDGFFETDNPKQFSYRVAAAACRFAKNPSLGQAMLSGMHSSYLSLLAVDGSGKPSFSTAHGQTLDDTIALFKADFQTRILRVTQKRGNLNGDDLLFYSGPALAALTITQPQIWIEQGIDPEQVKEVIRKRVHGYWAMSSLDRSSLEELAEVAIQTVLMPFPSLRTVHSEAFWGVSMETCKKIGRNPTLDVIKHHPVILGGGMMLFKGERANVVAGREPFNIFANPDSANKVLQKPWQSFVTPNFADRMACIELGRLKQRWPFEEITVARQSFMDWYLNSPSKDPRHPLVQSYLHWHEFLDEDQWAELFLKKLAHCSNGGHLDIFLHEFATTQPTRFDKVCYPILSDKRKTALHRALMPHVTSRMKSIALVSQPHRERVLSTDLGL